MVKIKYICEDCNSNYDNKKEAEACEAQPINEGNLDGLVLRDPSINTHHIFSKSNNSDKKRCLDENHNQLFTQYALMGAIDLTINKLGNDSNEEHITKYIRSNKLIHITEEQLSEVKERITKSFHNTRLYDERETTLESFLNNLRVK